MAVKTIIIQAKDLGRGDDRLGGLLMANMLRLMGESEDRPETIVFMNSGVHLICEGSQVLEHLKRLEGLGTELLACTTCLEYFDLTDKLEVGKPTNMYRTVQLIMESETVIL